MSLSVGRTESTSSSWAYHAACIRLMANRRRLAADLTPVQATAQVVAVDRQAVAASEEEIARLEQGRRRRLDVTV